MTVRHERERGVHVRLLEQRQAVGFADLDDFLASSVFASRQEQMTEVKALLGKEWLLECRQRYAINGLLLYLASPTLSKRLCSGATAGL